VNRSTYVIIPVFNEESVVREVIEQLQTYFSNIICVDDGSTDGSVAAIAETGVVLLRHRTNQGQGAALRSGIQYALKETDAKYFVTFDADGQHRPIDALAMVKNLQHSSKDIVLGSRFLGKAEDMPWAKRAILKLAIVFTNKTTGVKLTDTHNGLRAFNRRFAENLRLRCKGMAHASEFIYRIAEGNFKYGELPVTISYTKYSKSKGQSILNAFSILSELRAARKELAEQAE
jgi:glycosyltransferase involved in cell wall biosynthesis